MLIAVGIAAVALLLLLIVVLSVQRPQGPARDVPDEPRTMAEIAAMVREGHRAHAIEAYRAMTSCTITEAHDAIDRLARGEPVEPPPAARAGPAEPAPQDDPEVLRLVSAGQLIPAIKRLREVTGWDLITAKRAVDDLRSRAPSTAAPRPQAPPEPGSSVAGASDAEVTALARAGQLIQAIKLYRERTGLGLAESKVAVERMRDGLAPAPISPRPQASAPPTAQGSSDAELAAMARAGQLIQAIKLYRERTGLGLAESKAAVERLRDGA